MTAELVIAKDGLVARSAGDYAKQKLSFFDEFCPVALRVTNSNPHRAFVDLFAGPGVNVVRGTKQEVLGSALRALRIFGTARGSQFPFSDALFVNLDPKQHSALEQRVSRLCKAGESHISRNRIAVLQGDANKVVGDVMKRIPRAAYIVVFLDIEGPTDLPWTTVQELKAHGHTKIDLYVLYPTQGIARTLAYDPGEQERRAGRALDAYYGNKDWRPIAGSRPNEAQANAAAAKLHEHYAKQLRTMWAHVRTLKTARSGPNRIEYQMLFASNNDIAKKLAKWSGDKISVGGADAGQAGLFD